MQPSSSGLLVTCAYLPHTTLPELSDQMKVSEKFRACRVCVQRGSQGTH